MLKTNKYFGIGTVEVGLDTIFTTRPLWYVPVSSDTRTYPVVRTTDQSPTGKIVPVHTQMTSGMHTMMTGHSITGVVEGTGDNTEIYRNEKRRYADRLDAYKSALHEYDMGHTTVLPIPPAKSTELCELEKLRSLDTETSLLEKQVKDIVNDSLTNESLTRNIQDFTTQLSEGDRNYCKKLLSSKKRKFKSLIRELDICVQVGGYNPAGSAINYHLYAMDILQKAIGTQEEKV